MVDQKLAFTPAWRLAELIRARQVSPVELVDLVLSRIAALNPRLNAYLTVAGDQAMEAARAAEQALMDGQSVPALHGMPVSIKDLIPTRGIRTTYGSAVLLNNVPDEDALAVRRLRAAGAIIIGKTNTPEFGQSATTENYLLDDCRNPWQEERTSGGSSGGAAASVAAGLGPLALGSDGGGSIRIPAAFCGVVGLKPTFGRIPSVGGLGGMPLFAHLGPITRTVKDAALMLSVLAGFDRQDPYAIREPAPDVLAAVDANHGALLRDRSLAWSSDLGYAAVDPEVASVARGAAECLVDIGCHLEEASPEAGSPFEIFAPIIVADEYAAAGHLLEHHEAELMPYVRSTLEYGQVEMAYKYSRALSALAQFRARMAAFFERFDLLLTPTTAVTAFPVGQRPHVVAGREVGALWGAFPLTTSFNLTGQPAISVPCGFSSDGLPIGLQIVGRVGEECLVLGAAAAFEVVRPWADAFPPMATAR